MQAESAKGWRFASSDGRGSRARTRGHKCDRTSPVWRKQRRIVLGLAILMVSLLLAVAASLQAQPPSLVMISWDGAPDWVIDRLVEEGRLPTLGRIRKEGACAEYVVPSFPSKTAVGHSAVFTAAWPEVSGIVGNSVPAGTASQTTLTESLRGFDSRALTAEPVFVTAAKAGFQVAVLSATQSYPAEPHLAAIRASGADPGKFWSLSGFETTLAGRAMLTEKDFGALAGEWPGISTSPSFKEAEFEVAGTKFFALAYDDPSDPTKGLDTVAIRQGSRSGSGTSEAKLRPSSARDDSGFWSRPFRVGTGERSGGLAFRLFTLSPDGSQIELYRSSANALLGAASGASKASYEGSYPCFHDDAFGNYKSGLFGPTLVEGGSGEAERRIVEIVRRDCELLYAGTRWAWENLRPRLLTHYTPMSDSAGHTWIGLLDPDLPGHDPDLAAKIWPHYIKLFQLQDEWLGKVIDLVGNDAVVALFSDHGMEGISKYLNVQGVLEQAGLAAQSGRNIDLTKTQIACAAWEDFSLTVNRADRKGGIVAPGEVESVLTQATAALLSVRDPETNLPVVTSVWRARDVPGLGVSGGACGDLYFDLAPGYYPRRSFGAPVTKVTSEWREGVHGFYPERRKMHSILYVRGPGIRPGLVGPSLRQIDIVPTLCSGVGLPIPPQAQGHAVGQFWTSKSQG